MPWSEGESPFLAEALEGGSPEAEGPDRTDAAFEMEGPFVGSDDAQETETFPEGEYDPPPEAELETSSVVDLKATLEGAGVVVVAEAGWKTRGNSGFEPKGVLLHHTAASNKKLDAPSLN